MPTEPQRLRELSPQQVKSGLAAWLGWLFDGLDMHIFTLVAVSFVAILVNTGTFHSDFAVADKNHDGFLDAREWTAGDPWPMSDPVSALASSVAIHVNADAPHPGFKAADKNHDGHVSPEEYDVFAARTHTGDAEVKQKASWIQAAFLIGWALGGAFFGRLGDLIGRSRSLSLTVLTYAAFTGLSFFAHTWWQLMIFRFLAALGIGGEWAVGSTLLAETWPKKWRPWTAAVLQTGVNLGVIVAVIAGNLLAGQHPRWIFLIGVAPALLVFYIRRHVPEPETWAAEHSHAPKPGVLDLFRGTVRRTTLVSVGICAFSLTAWWAFMFWQTQYVRHLGAAMPQEACDHLVATTFGWVIGISIIGNFVAGALARLIGYKGAILIMFGGFAATMSLAFGTERPVAEMTGFWLPAVGFWSGVFGLFTMLLPPLFPTLLRTTGAGFSYNIGRIAAAVGTIFAAQITQGGNFRQTLLYDGLLFIPAMLFTLLLPLPPDEN